MVVTYLHAKIRSILLGQGFQKLWPGNRDRQTDICKRSMSDVPLLATREVWLVYYVCKLTIALRILNQRLQ